MKFLRIGLLLVCLGFSATVLNAQDSISFADTIYADLDIQENPHMPNKATMYSAVLPGLGQIYNGSWYKVPVVYGGFVALGLVVKWNNDRYLSHRQAYFDLNDSDPNTKSYEELKNWYYDVSTSSGVSQASDALKKAVSGYRRQRDLVVICSVGFYLLNVLDANVEAHFIDFDVSEDLSLNVQPALLPCEMGLPAVGFQLSLAF